ncbi:Ketimine reductase mu-crystallin [Manis javanica]|nr:Ketimine reductase mu-crystallin [Manis javanica]
MPSSTALDAQATAEGVALERTGRRDRRRAAAAPGSAGAGAHRDAPAGRWQPVCMPATDGQVAMTKLISFTPGNAGTPRATIQGDVVVFDVATGERRLILDGPTVTARRTAAVSLLAAQRLAPNPQGPLLIVGAGVQGLAHLQAFAAGLGVREVQVASRSARAPRRWSTRPGPWDCRPPPWRMWRRRRATAR